jgi:hypothetical protein
MSAASQSQCGALMRLIAFCKRRLGAARAAAFRDRIFKLSISTKSENAIAKYV